MWNSDECIIQKILSDSKIQKNVNIKHKKIANNMYHSYLDINMSVACILLNDEFEK